MTITIAELMVLRAKAKIETPWQARGSHPIGAGPVGGGDRIMTFGTGTRAQIEFITALVNWFDENAPLLTSKGYDPVTIEAAAAWQPIETAPKDGTWLLAIVNGIHPIIGKPFVPSVVHFDDGIWTENDRAGRDDEDWRPTHWMQLPEPPAIRNLSKQTD